jgi:hypothetical protein
MENNVDERYILIYSRRSILIMILSSSAVERYFIGDDGKASLEENEAVFVDVKFNRLFIQKKGEKVATIISYSMIEKDTNAEEKN